MATVLAVLAIQQWWITSQQVAMIPYSEFDKFRPAVAAAAKITI